MAPIPPPRISGYTGTTPVPLYWAEYGRPNATPLLVLHGGPGAHHDYLLPQLLALADDYRLIFYDQRGGGQSKTADRSAITWRTHVSDLDAVIQELSLDPATLVGYSWGGLLAMLFAIESAAGRTTSQIAKLVLLDPAPVNRAYRRQFEAEFARRQNSETVAKLRADLAVSRLRESDPDAFRQRSFELSVAGYFADPSAAHDLTPFRVMARIQDSVWDSLGDYDLTRPGQLDSVTAPALVVHGRQDPIPLASSEAIARALHAPLVSIDGAGHVPYVERPAEMFAAIRSFLSSAASRPPT
jgi:proline iminopeptidase